MIEDPTRDEMLEHLRDQFGDEPDEFDTEEAIYWFAYQWHGGQASNLYSVLSTSEFNPGPIATGPEPDSMAEMLLDSLVAEFAEPEASNGFSGDDIE